MRYSMRYFMAALCMVVFMATGCSEDELDRLNRVDNQPPVDVVDARLQLPDAVVSMAFTTLRGMLRHIPNRSSATAAHR